MLIVIDCLKNVYKWLTVPELTLNGYISAEKVLKTINRLSNKKTAESDRILNKILKRIGLTISMSFMQEIYTTFMCSSLLIYYKELIIIILYKKSKKNYLLFRSFRLITLKNMLIKIIKKILATYLSYIAEKHSLLLWIQIKARRDRSITSALNLLTSYIQIAWYINSNSIILMLSLNLLETFNNILYDKLLSILCEKNLSEWLV